MGVVTAGDGVCARTAGGRGHLDRASQVQERPATSEESQGGKGGRYRRQPTEEWEGHVGQGYPIMRTRGVVRQRTL